MYVTYVTLYRIINLIILDILQPKNTFRGACQ